MRLFGIRTSQALSVDDLKADTLRKRGTPFTRLELKDLGDPIVKTVNRIVAQTDMKVGDYTIAAQPDVPRKLYVTHDKEDELDTLGTIVIEGTNILDEPISETIVPEEDDVVVTENIFKSVTKVTGVGWVIDDVTGSEDQIQVGVEDMIGIPVDLEDYHQIIFAMLGTAIIPPEDLDDIRLGLMPNAGIDASGATYDGTKTLRVLVAFNRDYVS